MAKKLYHLPLQQIKNFEASNKSAICSLVSDNKKLEYYKRIGKSYYILAIQNSILILNIQKDINYALKLLNFFESQKFVEELMELVELKSICKAKREYLYILLYLLKRDKEELFDNFLHQLFMHYSLSLRDTPKQDAKTIAKELAKLKNITLKESFRDDKAKTYFRLLLDGKVVIEKEGKFIKKLRKEAYRELLDLKLL